MLIVIDTTMIFSLLLGKNVKMRAIFFDPENLFYAPNYVIGEIFEKKEKILQHSALSEAELYELLYWIFEKIRFVAETLISQKNQQNAYELCRDIDEDDTPIIALALQLNSVIWTGDKKLKDGLKSKGFNLFFEPKYEV